MAKNRNKRSKKNKEYEVGYKKPPKNTRWQKGCPSPNPKGRPKKPKTLKEAMQLTLNKEINVKNEKGELKKITGAEALANRALADAIAKDGATITMFFKDELLNLPVKEQEFEESPEQGNLAHMEDDEFMKNYRTMDPKTRESFLKHYTEYLRDKINEISRKKYGR